MAKADEAPVEGLQEAESVPEHAELCECEGASPDVDDESLDESSPDPASKLTESNNNRCIV